MRGRRGTNQEKISEVANYSVQLRGKKKGWEYVYNKKKIEAVNCNVQMFIIKNGITRGWRWSNQKKNKK